MSDLTGLRPGAFCQKVLLALSASEGRRRRRKRNTTPDAIGLSMKRSLLERAAREDPAPDDFEGWLLSACNGEDGGGVRAMALEILTEWQLFQVEPSFRVWLEQGAPSDDS